MFYAMKNLVTYMLAALSLQDGNISYCAV